MDFDFTDDQEQLRDAVRKWVDKGYNFERRRSIAKAGGFSREAYGQLAELGLSGRRDVVLIDACASNKPSASNVRDVEQGELALGTEQESIK